MGSPVKNKLSYEDLREAPADGRRYELLDGELHVTPAPGTTHQRIVRDLGFLLVEHFHGKRLGEVFLAPTDVILTDRDVVEPDLLVVTDPRQVSERGIEGAPLLVVEVLSPSTRAIDRTVKAQRYSRLGVLHYWIVDPDEKRVECLRATSDTYEIVATARQHEILKHPDWPELSIALAAFWP
jgi:Uma2 family endonuclease